MEDWLDKATRDGFLEVYVGGQTKGGRNGRLFNKANVTGGINAAIISDFEGNAFFNKASEGKIWNLWTFLFSIKDVGLFKIWKSDN